MGDAAEGDGVGRATVACVMPPDDRSESPTLLLATRGRELEQHSLLEWSLVGMENTG
jgi:hypothetical protein